MSPALLTAVESTGHVHLIVGSNPLAGARCAKSIEVGARPKLLAPADSDLPYTLAKRIEDGQVEWVKRDFNDEDLTTLGREEVDHVADAVFVTLGGDHTLSSRISQLCRHLRIPVNVSDAPSLCTFTLLSTHTAGPLQIGVTTSGKGCHLSSRIRREIVSSLPPDLGAAVERLGTLRRRIWEEDRAKEVGVNGDRGTEAVEDEDAGQTSQFNRLVRPEDFEVAKTRRMRWLQQICEYWPLRRLASITDADVDAVLEAYSTRSSSNTSVEPALPPSLASSTPEYPKLKGRIILAGSGPGHPSLLTLATLRAIQTADLILADKLVPAPILQLIPRRTTVHIARKFPGNADAAQDELLSLGFTGLQAGQTVLRLKQGDPFLYGRGAEEVSWFRERGYESVVLPGVTSALSGPLFCGIPVTHRAVSGEVLVCTGTGRKGAAPVPPSYREGRTVVWLMALHRVEALVESLRFKCWPRSTPCAVIERASCPDQRVIRTTLEHVAHAVEECGSRPPGLLVAGKACEVLHAPEQGKLWTVEEGLGAFGEWANETASGAWGMGVGLSSETIEGRKS
ncbi:uroporphyrin-III C-methyltransferase [Rhizodiscina lignyota]|uniref:Uroporphyrin-III C-methyltransferase n=1 Tax=Rhizodiscina lignyota TaxID=1504668 RepID=A0A9P4MBW0_9PEZI|nr:uroporphyrin-III C-methyltransferase [Rhizodiscina lignyota]